MVDVAERVGSEDLVRRISRATAGFYAEGLPVERWCYRVAAALFMSGVLHLGVQAVVGGPWGGPVSWRKPITFGLAFGLTLATVTWVTSFIPMAPRLRARVLTTFAGACVLEVVVITVQAWRAVPSHFNVSSTANAVFAYTAAVGGGVIMVSTVVIASQAFRARSPEVAPSMVLAVRAGLVTFVVALAIGAAMIAVGVHATRTISQNAGYTAAIYLKAGHAATMHGILILPALAWLSSFTMWTESRRIRVVAVACAGYVLAASVVVLETLTNLDPLDPLHAPLIALVPSVAGVVCLLGAAVAVLAALVRPD